MRIHSPWYTPFDTATSGTSADVPSRFMVALDGRPFNLDLQSGYFQRQSVPLLRTQADASGRPGEASINPEDLWRRTTSTWHKGAGQRNYDANDEADPARFWESQGIDCWTQGQISLLPAYESKTNGGTWMTVAGDYLYIATSSSVYYTSSAPDAAVYSEVSVTGLPGATISGITSDGKTIYIACGSSGIYTAARGAAPASSFATGTVTGVRYIKGRLFAWTGDKLYNVTGSGALPAALLDHPNADFTWVDVAEGPGFYFAAGYSGDKSIIYKTAVKADGTGLDVPTVAAQLPDGEIVSAIYGYLGFVLVGSNKGIRFGTSDSNGNITLGGLIDVAANVLCFEGQDRFVWFGWSHFTPLSDETLACGLGRLDLSQFNGTRPAYASDVLNLRQDLAGDGVVYSVVTYKGSQVFTVGSEGVFGPQADTFVDAGYIKTGRINYGLYEPKVSMFITVSHDPLEGTVEALMSADGGDFASVGGVSAIPGDVRSTFPTNQTRAELFELELILTPSSDLSASPVVTRQTLRAYPVAARSEQITVPLVISKSQVAPTGERFARDIVEDLAFLDDLENNGSVITYQQGSVSRSVVMQDHTFIPSQKSPDGAEFEGTYVATLKVFPEE